MINFGMMFELNQTAHLSIALSHKHALLATKLTINELRTTVVNLADLVQPNSLLNDCGPIERLKRSECQIFTSTVEKLYN
jgi:hypothetical protein